MTTCVQRLLALAFVLPIGMAGCDRSVDEASVPRVKQVDVANIAFPETFEIESGTSVRWVNKDENVRHTVTSGLPGEDDVPGVSEGKPARPDGRFDALLADGVTDFTFTFRAPGTYDYFCRVHPAMYSSVIVTP